MVNLIPMLRYLVGCCCWAEYSHGGPKPGLREAIHQMNKDMRDRIVIANRTAERGALTHTYVDLLTGEHIVCTAVNSSVRGDLGTNLGQAFQDSLVKWL